MRNIILPIAALILVASSVQACVYDTTTTQPTASGQATGTICDANGNNCHPCDAGTAGCQVTTSKKSWGFFF